MSRRARGLARRASAVLAAVAFGVVGGAAPAAGHTTSMGLADVRVSGTAVTYRLTLVLTELPEAMARTLAAAVDGREAEVVRTVTALREKVHARAGDAACAPGRARLQGSRLGDARVTLELEFACPRAPARLALRDDWADLFGEHYRTLARVEGPGGVVREAAFLPDAREATFELGAGASSAAGSFMWLGVEHILTGYDHLLFLAALLLGGGGLGGLLKIVTAFTLAHSTTLALAVLGVATVPARIVEPVIAASIAWVAIENVWLGRALARRWLVSFAFGLVHGFGFASALTPLALPRWDLALALVGFNVGVEMGQAAVIVAVLPLGLVLRRHPWRPRLVLGSSLALALVGAVWFVQRLFFT